jgi:hypothetical protein
MACNNLCINLPGENLHCRGWWKVADSNFRFRCYRNPCRTTRAPVGQGRGGSLDSGGHALAESDAIGVNNPALHQISLIKFPA